jgi:hypothetical protein
MESGSKQPEVSMHVQSPRLIIAIFVLLVVATAIYLFLRSG